MDLIKKMLLGLGGLIGGLAAAAVILAGFSGAGAACLLSGLAASPGGEEEGRGTVIEEQREGLPQIAAGLTASMDWDRGVQIPPEAMERLAAGWLSRLDKKTDEPGIPVDGMPGVRIAPRTVALSLEENRFRGAVSGNIVLDRPLREILFPQGDYPLEGWPGGELVGNIRRWPAAVEAVGGLTSRGTVLTVRAEQVRLGAWRLPLSLLARAGENLLFLPATEEAEGSGNGLAVDLRRRELRIPLDSLNRYLQGAARVRNVRVQEGGLLLELVMERRLADTVMEAVQPIVRREGAQVVSLLEEAAPGKKGREISGKVRQVMEAVLSYGGVPAGAGQAEISGIPGNREVPTALLSYLEGEVLVYRGDSSFSAALGERTAEGDTVKTGVRGVAELILPDKSLVRVGPQTRFHLTDLSRGDAGGSGTAGGGGGLGDSGDNGTRLGLAFGAVRAKVQTLAGSAGGSSGFAVETEQAVMGVRGTDFTVTYDAAEGLGVAVLEGEVEVDPAQSDPLSLKRNERTDVSADQLKESFTALEKERISPEEREKIREQTGFRSRPEEADSLRSSREVAQILTLLQETVRLVEQMEPREREAVLRRLEDQYSGRRGERLQQEIKKALGSDLRIYQEKLDGIDGIWIQGQ